MSNGRKSLYRYAAGMAYSFQIAARHAEAASLNSEGLERSQYLDHLPRPVGSQLSNDTVSRTQMFLTRAIDDLEGHLLDPLE